VIDNIKKMLRPLVRRVQSMIARSVIDSVNDGLKAQGLQIRLLGETRSAERFQQYGFTSVPLPGAEAVLVAPDGDQSHGIVIATDDRRYRLKNLQAGEVALYNDQGSKVHLKKTGDILVENKNTGILLKADGNIEIGEGVLESILNGATFQALYNAHTQTGGFVVPVGPPVIQANALSSKVKAVT
jgi:phage baseplate assembly protein V